MPAFSLKWSRNTITPGLRKMAKRSGNLNRPLAEFGVYMIGSIAQNFRQQGRRKGVGRRWKKLAKSTIARRRKGRRANPKILIASAILKNSTTTAHDMTGNFAVGTTVPYAPDHHQRGRWGARKHIVAALRIPQHTRTMWVRQSFDPSATLGARLATVTRATTATRKPAGRKVSKPKRRKRGGLVRRKRGGLVRRKVIVTAHVQNHDYYLPARPIYLFQPADMKRLLKIMAKWSLRGGTQVRS